MSEDMTLENADIEIAKMKLQFDIGAYQAQVFDCRRKILESRKSIVLQERQIADLQAKISERQDEMRKLG